MAPTRSHVANDKQQKESTDGDKGKGRFSKQQHMVKSVPTLRSSKRAQDSDERSLVQQKVKTSHSDPEQQHTQSHDAATGRETQRVCAFVLPLSNLSPSMCLSLPAYRKVP